MFKFSFASIMDTNYLFLNKNIFIVIHELLYKKKEKNGFLNVLNRLIHEIS